MSAKLANPTATTGETPPSPATTAMTITPTAVAAGAIRRRWSTSTPAARQGSNGAAPIKNNNANATGRVMSSKYGSPTEI